MTGAGARRTGPGTPAEGPWAFVNRPPRPGFLLGSAVLFALLCLVHDLIFGYAPQADALLYMERAAQFASGDFAVPETNWNLAPGYSLFLAPFYLLADDPPWPLLVAASAGAAAGGYLLLVRTLAGLGILGARGAWLAAAAFVLNPLLWGSFGQVLSESWVVGLAATVFALGLRAGSPHTLAALAAASGWLVVTRFEYAAAVGVLGVGLLLLRGRRAVPTVAALAVGGALTLGANAVRNAAMFGEVNPFSYGGGTVAYGGVNVTGSASWHTASCDPAGYEPYLPEDFHARYAALCDRLDAGETPYPEIDALFREMARRQWSEQPVRTLGLIPQKVGKLWLVPGFFDIYTGDRTFTRGLRLGAYFDRGIWPVHGVLKHVGYFVLHWGTLAAVLFGGWRLARRTGDARAWIVMSGVVAVLLSAVYSVALYGLPRFHDPLLGLLLTWTGGLPSTRSVDGS